MQVSEKFDEFIKYWSKIDQYFTNHGYNCVRTVMNKYAPELSTDYINADLGITFHISYMPDDAYKNPIELISGILFRKDDAFLDLSLKKFIQIEYGTDEKLSLLSYSGDFAAKMTQLIKFIFEVLQNKKMIAMLTGIDWDKKYHSPWWEGTNL